MQAEHGCAPLRGTASFSCCRACSTAVFACAACTPVALAAASRRCSSLEAGPAARMAAVALRSSSLPQAAPCQSLACPHTMQRERSLRWQYTCCAGSTMQVTSFLHAAQAGGAAHLIDSEASRVWLRADLNSAVSACSCLRTASRASSCASAASCTTALPPAPHWSLQPARTLHEPSHGLLPPRRRATHSCAHTTGKVLHTLP